MGLKNLLKLHIYIYYSSTFVNFYEDLVLLILFRNGQMSNHMFKISGELFKFQLIFLEFVTCIKLFWFPKFQLIFLEFVVLNYLGLNKLGMHTSIM